MEALRQLHCLHVDDLIITEELNRYVHIAYFRVSHAYISNSLFVFDIIVVLTPTIP